MSAQQTPPPRKGNYLKVLKNVHTEQLSKVQWKHQQECELLEDLKNFIKQRCAIEKSYGEAMQKISASYLNKKMPPIHELNDDEASPRQWTVWSIWRQLLEETDKLAKAKLAAVDVLHSQIGEDVKIVRQNKLQLAKKNLDLLKSVQGEVQTCVTELDKLKKVYVDDEHVSHDARDKAREAEEKLKKKKGGIFQSVSSLQKTSAKLGSRRDLCEEKSTHARNSYLLQLASANAHQNRYFHVDLQNVVKTLDGGMYEKVAEYFSILSRTELITCSASTTSYGKIKEQAQTINRDYDLACFVAAFPVLNQHITYEYEPCDNDIISTVDPSHGTQPGLITMGKQYASRAVQETKKIRETTRSLHAMQAMRDNGIKVDPNEPHADIETKIDELKNQLRRAETAKVKAEARLDCLRKGGIKVDEFLQEAEGLASLGLMRSSSQLSFRDTGQEDDATSDSGSRAQETGGVGGTASAAAQDYYPDSDDEEAVDEDHHAIQQQLADMRATWQDPAAAWDEPATVTASSITSVQVEVSDDVGSSERSVSFSQHQTSGSVGDGVVKCIAFYSYTAQNADELSMTENEELEVLLAYSEGDGWVKARNYKGEEGFVPQNYLDLYHADDDAVQSADGIESHQDDVVDENHLQAHAPIGQHETEEEEAGGIEQQISFSSVDYTYQHPDDEYADFPQPADEDPPVENANLNHLPAASSAAPALVVGLLGYCRALYDYDATSDEELTFYEGEVIAILRRSGVHGDDVDDGWWEGQLLPDGPTGVFPSLVVEECGPNGEELTPKGTPVDENNSAPPPGTPPLVPTFLLPPERVIITQPTPECEHQPDQSHLFDQNATIKDEEEDGELASEMVVVEPATPTEEEANNNNNTDQNVGLEASGTQIIITASTPVVETAEAEVVSEEESVVEVVPLASEGSEPPPEPAPEPDQFGFDDEFVQLEATGAKESYA